MKKNFNIFIVLEVFFLSTCMCTKPNASDVDVLVEIDLDQSKQISYTEWFDSIQIFPLETNDQSIIGLSIKTFIYDDLIYIFDGKTHLINVFDKNGKFINNTSHIRGEGPNQYPGIQSIDIDEITGYISIYDFYKIRIFNSNFEFVNEFETPDELWSSGLNRLITEDLFLFFNYAPEEDFLFKVFSIKEKKIIKKIFPFEMGNEAKKMTATRRQTFYKNNDTLFFKTKFPDNKVYYFDSTKVDFFPRIEFKIKQEEFTSSKLIKDQDLQYYRGMAFSSDKYAFILEIFESEKYFFSLILYRKKGYLNRYDKKVGENQVVDHDFLDGISLLNPILIKDNVIYVRIDASMIREYIEKSDFLSKKYNYLLENISEEDNPYIVKFFIKD